MSTLNKLCPNPFQCVEIHISGAVYFCCPDWNKYYEIGNIYKNSLEEIWNSQKAIDLRTKIINNDYSLCNNLRCPLLENKLFYTNYKTEYKPIMKTNPLIIKFAYDYECNSSCRICRDKIYRLTDKELNLLNSKIETFFLPLLKSAKVLIINSAGDPFGSRHSRLLIKKAIEAYPNLKFDFHTNGINCNQKMFEELNITPDKINQMLISMHSASKKTYSALVNSSSGAQMFQTIIKNLSYLKKLQKTFNFKIHLNFVITTFNYHEIPKFIELAEKYQAIPQFWEYRKTDCSYDNNEDHDLYNENHKFHKKLIKILKNKKVKKYKEKFSPIYQAFIS